MSELVDRLRKTFDSGVPLRLSKDGGSAEIDPLCNEAANRIVVLEGACKFAEREAEQLRAERDAALQERDLAEHRQGEAMAECDALRKRVELLEDELRVAQIRLSNLGKPTNAIDAALAKDGKQRLLERSVDTAMSYRGNRDDDAALAKGGGDDAD